ncbi:hypothetical protein M3P05_00015 [Sansalvadorimonas sp. 2012CJ34-2]|uniref:Uncharacterized protein n=1 Tax=Parendozoicomonas callyspongiae TaxID=2942213 RepID=A0ABT0PAF6_9GAMM|nr:hypothetical protein [Sansalvadorimonas sp. 2012CJ34-2]MCL6268335.1 hypothetical protein [Sansalvadorimonas sp. 2012CJ34-2]
MRNYICGVFAGVTGHFLVSGCGNRIKDMGDILTLLATAIIGWQLP